MFSGLPAPAQTRMMLAARSQSESFKWRLARSRSRFGSGLSDTNSIIFPNVSLGAFMSAKREMFRVVGTADVVGPLRGDSVGAVRAGSLRS